MGEFTFANPPSQKKAQITKKKLKKKSKALPAVPDPSIYLNFDPNDYDEEEKPPFYKEHIELVRNKNIKKQIGGLELHLNNPIGVEYKPCKSILSTIKNDQNSFQFCANLVGTLKKPDKSIGILKNEKFEILLDDGTKELRFELLVPIQNYVTEIELIAISARGERISESFNVVVCNL